MAIPSDIRAQAETALEVFCRQHSSGAADDPLRYAHKFEPNAAILLQQRPGFVSREEWVSKPVAKFRYSEARNTWTLYWMDANGRWHRVSDVKAESDINALLKIVVSDPLGVFWS